MNAELEGRITRAINDGKYIQATRIFLMPIDVADARDVYKWVGDPDVTRFMNYSTYTSVSDVADWIKRDGHKSFGIFLKECGQLIGGGDARKNRSGDIELGYNLAKAYWGKGYCTEAAKAIIAYNVAQGTTDFVCKHAQDNVRSSRVIQKCGFVYVKDGSYTSFDGLRTFVDKEYALHIKRFEMDVDSEWFCKIIRGDKTVELRLNDEKRRGISVGDFVILNNLDGSALLRKCVVRVTQLHYFSDFNGLYASLDMSKCGYGADKKASPDDMLKYYSAERQAQYGVVGIQFELLAVM